MHVLHHSASLSMVACTLTTTYYYTTTQSVICARENSASVLTMKSCAVQISENEWLATAATRNYRTENKIE